MRRFSAFLTVAPLLVATFAVSATEPTPWEKPRSLETFQKLLGHSPFSLPTAEESSPLADRFSITGIITEGEDVQVFVFDRTDQSRTLLTKKPNEKDMCLVSIVRDDGSATPRASIRVGSESGTISFMEASKQPQTAPPAPGSPAGGASQGQQAVQLPSLPPLPQQPSAAPPSRRIIRRPVVAPPQPQHQP
jgi:hypothetical protein